VSGSAQLRGAKALLHDGGLRRIGQRSGDAGPDGAPRLRAPTPRQQEPAVAPVTVEHAAFVMEVIRLAGEMRLEGFLELTDVLGVARGRSILPARAMPAAPGEPIIASQRLET